MKLRFLRYTPAEHVSHGWPPRADRVLWVWIAAAIAVPVLSWAMGRVVWIRFGGDSFYTPTNPLVWTALPLVLAAFLALRWGVAFRLAFWALMATGLVLMGSWLQAPTALAHVGFTGTGLDDETYLRVATDYALAFLAGGIDVGIAAYLLRYGLSEAAARGR
ncbi:MAG: hypothetical protein AAF430_22415 [Myxococcota bacterium]